MQKIQQTQKIQCGVIGLGRIGKLHVENIVRFVPGLEIKAIADLQVDMNWASQFNIPVITTNPTVLINDPSIQAVIIATPVDSHLEYIYAVAEQRKHIFCEKPLARDQAEIQSIIDIVQKNGIKCQVGFNRRFDPQFAKAAALLHAKEMGKPYLLRITSRDPGLPALSYLQSSGGMFNDMTIHDFDMARFLIQDEVESIFACGGAYVDPAVAQCNDIDTAVIQLKFKSGVLGVIENCRHAAYGYDQRVEILCEKGNIQVENTRPTSVTVRNASGQTADKPHHFFLERYQQSYIEEFKAFYQSIIDDRPVEVSAVDALPPFWMAACAQQSLLNQRVVSLPSA